MSNLKTPFRYDFVGSFLDQRDLRKREELLITVISATMS